jgi:hypothetical protein
MIDKVVLIGLFILKGDSPDLTDTHIRLRTLKECEAKAAKWFGKPTHALHWECRRLVYTRQRD